MAGLVPAISILIIIALILRELREQFVSKSLPRT
jgi:hypothetical protein